MKPFKKKLETDEEFEQFTQLLYAAMKDPVIHDKILKTLKMDSFKRRIVLNNWLEQLRLKKAPEKLRRLLAYLFDDAIAEKTILLLKRQENNKSGY